MPPVVEPGGDTFDPGDPPHGLCLAINDRTLEPSPTWTRLDDPANSWRLRVNSVSIDRGVDSDTDTVKTGTCVAVLNDPFGTLDPTNPTSPFWVAGETQLNPNIQAAYARWNPVDGSWSTRFRGFLKAIRYTMDTSGFSQVVLELVDAFEILADLRLSPAYHGTTPPDESIGDVYYAGGSVFPSQNTFKHVDDRIAQVLDDLGWPGTGNTIDLPNLRNIFSGNVSVQEAVYARDGQAIEVMTDAADAEFPDVSRLFVSREGVVSFRGRFARFFPENPGYGIGNWEVGGSAEAIADTDVVLLQNFTFRRSKEDIINVATALPRGIDENNVAAQIVENGTSIATYGRRFWMSDNLLTWHGHDEDNNETTAAEETRKFAQFKVDNFGNPKNRIEQITVTARHPDADSAAANWEFLQGVELGDLAHIATTHRGGGGFDEDYYVEAIREVDTPADPAFHMVRAEIDVSPRSYYDENPFGDVDDGVS